MKIKNESSVRSGSAAFLVSSVGSTNGWSVTVTSSTAITEPWPSYLVLVTVADAEGLSYYSDGTLERMLNMEHAQLLNARHQLCQAGMLVYDKPLYQILSLELPLEASGVAEPAAVRSGQPIAVADILRRIAGGGA
jgi:hypothetical protein